MKVKRIIYPPIWLVFGLAAQFYLNTYYPGLRFTGSVGYAVGGLIILAGLVLLVMANQLFSRDGTDAIPFRNVSALVTDGIYARTRNPMYLGMALVLVGVALTLGAATTLLVPPLFIVIIEARFIRAEEALLRDLFPQDYPAYCDKVRRWL